MTGIQKAAIIIALAVIGMVALNVAMWRRMRRVLRERPHWREADLTAMLAEQGCTPPVIDAVVAGVRPCYAAGVVPHPGDSFARFLAVDEEEVADIVAVAWARLDLPEPTTTTPERIPELDTVGDLAAYLQRRHAAITAGPGSAVADGPVAG